MFKGTTGIVLEASAPEDRLALTSDLLIALFVGLSVPVVGAGIALKQGPAHRARVRHSRGTRRFRLRSGTSTTPGRRSGPRCVTRIISAQVRCSPWAFRPRAREDARHAEPAPRGVCRCATLMS